MKKTLSMELRIALVALVVILTSLMVVSSVSASGLCRGVTGYYGDCSDDPYRYQTSTTPSSSSSSSFRGPNSEVYQFNSVTRNSNSVDYNAYYSPSYPSNTGSMPYFTGGTAGYNQYYDNYYGYDGYGSYGGYGYDGYGYPPGYDYYGYSGYGYSPNAFDYGLGIASAYSPRQAQPWLGVASMVQQFFWI
ncbi:Uncharacterised protein [uncultured archaeon]|nr:Uncharacterised protein [uncultured archaeon]